VFQLLGEAISLPPEQRPAFLDRVCKDDLGLRAEIERLLDADDQARGQSFMDSPELPRLSSTASTTATTSPTVFISGQLIAERYRIIRFLGKGGMGQVYQAKDEVLDSFVALKTIRPEIAANRGMGDRFKKEVKLAHEVADENVCRVFDLDHRHQPPFLTMEFIDGETLSVHLRRLAREKTRMTTGDALRLIEQMAHGLQAAHQKGVIHGDFKPGNVMLTAASGNSTLAKITDFGLARTQNAEVPLVADGPAGTPPYMAPEQLAGGNATIASDIYAFGLVMYEISTGVRPEFDRHSDPVPDPRQYASDLTEDVASAILRCLERDPALRFASAEQVAVAIRGRMSRADKIERWVRGHPRSLAAAGIVGLLMTLVLYWRLAYSAPGSESVLTALTNDSGLSDYPTISLDGKWMAYASDRSGDGSRDIWLQQIGGGDPTRLTSDPSDEYDPSFSPDHARIAFRSEHEGGGIYIVPTSGGESWLFARGGSGPRFSTDGKWIAFWVGSPGGGFVPGSSQVYVKSVRDGLAKLVQTGLIAAFSPVWAPDSKRLLVVGKPDAKQDSKLSVDWWVVPLNGGRPSKTFALQAFRDQGLIPPVGQDWIIPSTWQPGDNHVLFSAKSGDTTSVWEIAMTDGGKVVRPANRRTLTTAIDLHASVSLDRKGEPRRMLFSSLSGNVNIWSLPIDANTGINTGTMEKLVPGAYAAVPSVSIDGTKLVFVTTHSRTCSAKRRDLETGTETTLTTAELTNSGDDWLWPHVSPDGQTVAYVDKSDRMFLFNARTGTTQRICDDCGPPTDVSTNGDKVLFEPLHPPDYVMMIDVPSSRIIPLVRSENPDHLLYDGRFSPDGRWVAFNAALDSSLNKKVFISPIRDGLALAEADWIPVTDGKQVDQNVAWSPDGNLLYFLSERDGFRCIWAQRLLPSSKRADGLAFSVQHFHHQRQSLSRIERWGRIGISAARGKLIFAMSELTGNIWMEERKNPVTAWLSRLFPIP
jgi:serine/threonine protein kinase